MLKSWPRDCNFMTMIFKTKDQMKDMYIMHTN